MGDRRDSARISPTAHYTGQVWVRAGLAPPAFGTRLGVGLHGAAAPVLRAVRRVWPDLSLDGYLLDRHRAIDEILTRAIETGRVGQVLEIAAGLSPRGVRLASRHGPGLRYVEADLPAMARTKRARLAAAGLAPEGHEVVEVDVLAPGGPRSLERVFASRLDPAVGVAIVAEGLLSYFPRPRVEGLLARSAWLLGRPPAGLFVGSLELGGEAGRVAPARALALFLQAFTGGGVHLHYESDEDARGAVERAGFGAVTLHLPADLLTDPQGPQLVRIIEAWARPISSGREG